MKGGRRVMTKGKENRKKKRGRKKEDRGSEKKIYKKLEKAKS